MNNENHTERASIGIGRDVKDGVVVSGKDNTVNVNITNITQFPLKEEANPKAMLEKIKVFISYATEDYEMAKKLYDDLKNAGAEPWLDRENLFAGQDRKLIITKNIKDCRYFLLLISEHSVYRQGFFQKEQKIALELLDESPLNEIRIIPARLDNTEPIDERLKNLHWADLSDYDKGFKQILDSMNIIPTESNKIISLEPFKKEIYGIIVAQFSGDTDVQKNKGKEIQGTIQHTLNARFNELEIRDAKAIKASESFESCEQARRFGIKYQAELVIWGNVTIQGVIPNLTIVNSDYYISKVIKSDTSILKDSLCHDALKSVSDIRFPALTDESILLVSYIIGLKYFNQENYEKSIEYFTHSLSAKPVKSIDIGFIFFFRGTSQLFIKEYDKAIDDYSKAIEINREDYMAYNNRGLAYNRKDKHDEAIEDYKTAIRIYPCDCAYQNLGNSYWYKNEYDKAIDNYNKAIDIKPQYDSTYTNRGVAYNAKGDYDKAYDDHNTAIKINPNNALAYNNLSWLFSACPDAKYRDVDKAIEFAKKAIELSPNNCLYRNTLAFAYAEAGKFDLAVKNQEKSIEMLDEKDKDKFLSEYTEPLNSYKANKPWREKHKSGIRESSSRP